MRSIIAGKVFVYQWTAKVIIRWVDVAWMLTVSNLQFNSFRSEVSLAISTFYIFLPETHGWILRNNDTKVRWMWRLEDVKKEAYFIFRFKSFIVGTKKGNWIVFWVHHTPDCCVFVRCRLNTDQYRISKGVVRKKISCLNIIYTVYYNVET